MCKHSPCVFVSTCVSPISSLCFLVTYCLGDKAFIFPLCKFFSFFLHESSVYSLFFCYECSDQTSRYQKVISSIQTFSLNFKCEYFSKFIFSFPLRTKQLIISCDVEKSVKLFTKICRITEWTAAILWPPTPILASGNWSVDWAFQLCEPGSDRMSLNSLVCVLTPQGLAHLVLGHSIVYLRAEFLSPSWTWARPLCSGG